MTCFFQCREHILVFQTRVTFLPNRDTFSFFVFSSVFLLFLLHKLPCELQNVIKLHRKLRNDKMSSWVYGASRTGSNEPQRLFVRSRNYFSSGYTLSSSKRHKHSSIKQDQYMTIRLKTHVSSKAQFQVYTNHKIKHFLCSLFNPRTSLK